jgi:large subunit ribosomal protein L23
MALFNRTKKKTDDEKSEAKVKAQAASAKAEAKKDLAVKKEVLSSEASEAKAGAYARILLKPHVSEKAAILAEKGIYVFNVPLSSNKIEVKKAVQSIYHVSVVKVRMQRGIGKIMNRNRIAGRRSTWKKALVELAPGQKIHVVEGV